MRQIEQKQLKLGQVDIASIQFDPKSRDDIPQLLRGLQHIYTTPSVRDQIFALLEKLPPDSVDKNNGRPGMDLWNILVMGVLRLNLNWDYDRLHEMVNNHKTIRAMLGHGLYDDDRGYHVQTLKDNVALLTPEILDDISAIVVKAGHAAFKKKDSEKLKGRCDSFVVETDVHYPTDINLLWDAIRKIVILSHRLSLEIGETFWRQHQFNLRQVKKLYRKAQKARHSTSKDEKKKAEKAEAVAEAHSTYCNMAKTLIDKAEMTLSFAATRSESMVDKAFSIKQASSEIQKYITHARRQIDQTERRVIHGETIPHDEKVFSLFEEHTEWISKGKAGVPVELGLKVCIMEDQQGFILHHQVMQKTLDVDIAVDMVTETKQHFPNLVACSYDKGFHSPGNQKELKNHLESVILPKKGRRNREETEREQSEEFRQLKRQHSAVESGINALEIHGLDKCPDHGIDGFRRYVSLAVLARNIQKLGAGLCERSKRRKAA